MKLGGQAAGFAGLLGAIAPAEASAIVGAGPGRLSHSGLNLGPAVVGFAKTADEDDGWGAGADAEDMIFPTANIDQAAGWRIAGFNSPGGDQLEDGTGEGGQGYTRKQKKKDCSYSTASSNGGKTRSSVIRS